MRSFQPKRAKAKRQFQPPQREAAHKRGYDGEWHQLRNRYIELHPVCQYCQAAKAQEVDHVIPFDGLSDPKRLEWKNLKSACRSCHARKTWRDKQILCRGEGQMKENGE